MQAQEIGYGLAFDELVELRVSIAEQFSALKTEIENPKREIAMLKFVFGGNFCVCLTFDFLYVSKKPHPFDQVTESPNVGHDDRAAMLLYGQTCRV